MGQDESPAALTRRVSKIQRHPECVRDIADLRLEPPISLGRAG